MTTFKSLKCSASLDDGILTLESGRVIDMGLVEKVLAHIASAEYDEHAEEALKALDELRGGVATTDVNALATSKLVGTREVFIEAYGTSDCGDAPAFAKVLVDQAFVDRLARMSQLCSNNNLSELRIQSSPERWGPGEIEDDLRLQSPELVITSNAFWFTDNPKHADYSIESRSQIIKEFTAQVMAQPDGQRLMLGDDLEYADMVDEDEEQVALAALRTEGATHEATALAPFALCTFQEKLADLYHTTEKSNDSLNLSGEHHVVGLQIEPSEVPGGRFIYFSVDNPLNNGTVLRGMTFCDYRETSIEGIREKAIECATRVIGRVDQAIFEVDSVISAGGLLYPEPADDAHDFPRP